MIGEKIGLGAGWRGADDYLIYGSKEKPRPPDALGEVICGTLAGQSPRARAREVGALRRLRPDCRKAVMHFSLSLPPGQSLASEKWDLAAKVFMKEMGVDLDRHQWMGVKHIDRHHQHLHILINRVPLDGGNLAREKKTTTT